MDDNFETESRLYICIFINIYICTMCYIYMYYQAIKQDEFIIENDTLFLTFY